MCIIRLLQPASHKGIPSYKKPPGHISMTGGFPSIFIVRLIVIFLLLSRSVFDTVEDLVMFYIECHHQETGNLVSTHEHPQGP